MKKILLSISFLLASLLLSNIYAQATMPEISTSDNEVWYYIQFTKGNAVLEDFGEAVPLTTQNVSLINAEQHWKIVEASKPSGEYKYEIESAKGHKLCYLSSRFVTSKTSTAALFSIVKSTSTAYPGFVLKYNSGYMNQKGGETFGKLLERGTSLASAGSSLIFVPTHLMEEPPGPEIPKVSSVDDSDETWYYIQFNRTSNTSLKPVLQDMGENAKLRTENAKENSNAQLWKLIPASAPNGDYEYELISKTGRKIAYNSTLSRYITTSSSAGAKLKLTEVYPDWAIQRYGRGTSGMNQSGGAGPGREICDYSYSDQGSICNFVTPQKMWGYTSLPAIDTDKEKRTRISMDNKSLKIEGEDIKNVTIYSVAGQILNTRTNSFSYELPGGVYILSVSYADSVTETIKVAVK
ncbi:MAG: T9SS type A sorting domain-containing protein [Bacteroidales bacterium]|nr:T9SS type A sorting domain-containing protein [Bacteroidales bacterium]